jgi:hypothetical protein
MALPSLSTKDVRNIEAMIKAWSAKLTWDLLVERIESDLGIITTRQTLNTYSSIKATFSEQKLVLRGKPSDSLIKFTQGDMKLAERIERLSADNAALESKVEKQRAFIAEIADVAKSNPTVMSVLETVKHRVSKSTKKD